MLHPAHTCCNRTHRPAQDAGSLLPHGMPGSFHVPHANAPLTLQQLSTHARLALWSPRSQTLRAQADALLPRLSSSSPISGSWDGANFIYVLLLSAASWLTTGGRDEPCPGRISPLACPDPDGLHPSSFRAYACSMLNTSDPPPLPFRWCGRLEHMGTVAGGDDQADPGSSFARQSGGGGCGRPRRLWHEGEQLKEAFLQPMGADQAQHIPLQVWALAARFLMGKPRPGLHTGGTWLRLLQKGS